MSKPRERKIELVAGALDRRRRSRPLRAEEWTVRELRLVELHYGRMPRKELVARYLPDRTIKAVEYRAGLLGVRRHVKPSQHWPPVEVEVLKRYYGRMPRKELSARYLPHRSIKQLDYKAGALGLRRRRRPTRSWSAEDLALLRRLHGTMPIAELRSRYFPRISITAIAHRARRLGLRSKEPNWTAKEERVIKRHYGRMTNWALAARHLPGRTAEAVQGRATKLGLTREIQDVWSAKELRLLKRHGWVCHEPAIPGLPATTRCCVGSFRVTASRQGFPGIRRARYVCARRNSACGRGHTVCSCPARPRVASAIRECSTHTARRILQPTCAADGGSWSHDLSPAVLHVEMLATSRRQCASERAVIV